MLEAILPEADVVIDRFHFISVRVFGELPLQLLLSRVDLAAEPALLSAAAMALVD